MEDIVRICLHLVIENLMDIRVKTIEILNKNMDPDVQIISPIIIDVLADLPLMQVWNFSYILTYIKII